LLHCGTLIRNLELENLQRSARRSLLRQTLHSACLHVLGEYCKVQQFRGRAQSRVLLDSGVVFRCWLHTCNTWPCKAPAGSQQRKMCALFHNLCKACSARALCSIMLPTTSFICLLTAARAGGHECCQAQDSCAGKSGNGCRAGQRAG